jgi:hypothetical protein
MQGIQFGSMSATTGRSDKVDARIVEPSFGRARLRC